MDDRERNEDALANDIFKELGVERKPLDPDRPIITYLPKLMPQQQRD